MSLHELLKLTKNVIKKDNINKLILVRSCENQGALSGCLNGWLDTKLTDYGRKQAKHLSLEYFVNFKPENDFSGVYHSDLHRSQETANISLAYEIVKNTISQDLREIYFGAQEGYFYDGLSKEEKSQINKPNHKFPKGESWMDVKYRACKFIMNIKNKKYDKPVLVFTHGGFISSLLYSKGFKKMPNPGSVLIVSYKDFEEENLEDKTFLSLYNEYSKVLNCPDENFNENFFNKYNPRFENYLSKCINEVEIVYDVPDISEEIF